ncbi:MAG TPA: hypothetical protein VG269_16850 [Tepidisphaeraceae bacterium]|jgi:REP element-mobilizing transposase RayT|nr:hypothetical protein [Tepidisphaeraceae bacterium]
MVIAHHLVWTAYGWWLPNDPRGSTSRCIRNDLIAELGELHYGRKRIQPASARIREFYAVAPTFLEFPLKTLSPDDFPVVARAFAGTVMANRYTCYACAVMPDHIHILIRKHKHLAEEMIQNLQRESHIGLREAGLYDLEHPVWGGPGWKVFLDHPDDIVRTVRYVEQNPIKIGLPRQHWDFVKPYDGWPLHAGHDPNSPYARAFREARKG